MTGRDPLRGINASMEYLTSSPLLATCAGPDSLSLETETAIEALEIPMWVPVCHPERPN